MRRKSPSDLHFVNVVNLCQEHGLFDGRVPTAAQERRGNTEFGRLLLRYKDREFQNGLRFRVRGAGHGRRYAIEAPRVVDAVAV